MPVSIDQQLHSAIELLNTAQKKAVLGILKVIAGGNETETGDHWQNKNFVAEMESRYAYYKNGGKMISSEEANKQIKSLLQHTKSK